MSISSYKDKDGNIHWKPDPVILSQKWYGLGLINWLAAENDTIVTVTWTVPTGLTLMEQRITTLNQPEVKLQADTIGSYEVICTVDTIEISDTQKSIWKLYIEVV